VHSLEAIVDLTRSLSGPMDKTSDPRNWLKAMAA
jgi:hypothetical protein